MKDTWVCACGFKAPLREILRHLDVVTTDRRESGCYYAKSLRG